MPAEWEPHEATWLAWPHERTDWPGKFAPIPWVYAEIVRHLARVERVRILVEDADAEAARPRAFCKKCRRGSERRRFLPSCPPTAAGPATSARFSSRTRAGRNRLSPHWSFNGWAKYDNCRKMTATP